MNLLFQPQMNTRPMSLLNAYPNRYIPGQSVPGAEQPLTPPVVQQPLGSDQQYGDVANDPNDVDTADIGTMSVAGLQDVVDQTSMIGLMPGMGLPAAISKAMAMSELSSRGLDSNGQPTDIGNLDGPGYSGGPANGGNTSSGAGTGIGGSGGDGPTGTGGNGGGDPSMGGDGSSGLAGGGYVGYALDNNPSPVSEHGTARDNVMLPMNSQEGVLPPDVMEYIGVDGLNEIIQKVRSQAQAANAAQDQKNARLGLLG